MYSITVIPFKMSPIHPYRVSTRKPSNSSNGGCPLPIGPGPGGRFSAIPSAYTYHATCHPWFSNCSSSPVARKPARYVQSVQRAALLVSAPRPRCSLRSELPARSSLHSESRVIFVAQRTGSDLRCAANPAEAIFPIWPGCHGRGGDLFGGWHPVFQPGNAPAHPDFVACRLTR